MGEVISLHAERWLVVFEESGILVRVSTKGSVDFRVTDTDTGVVAYSKSLTMQQMAKLGEALSIAYTEEKENGDG